MTKHIINNISKYLLIALFTIYTSINLYIFMNERTNTNEYNFADIQTQFKGYTLEDKYISRDNCIFIIKNPINNKSNRVKVTEVLYYKVYFVGDTIK